jgi:Outer membrane protein beta-barrel domain
LRKTSLLAFVTAIIFLASFAQAQQGDAMFGGGTILAAGETSCPSTGGFCFVPEKGGFYPSLSADVIFHKRIGFGFETAWRGGQGDYAGLGIPYRPIMFDFNAVYQPKLSKKAGLDLMGGIGWQTTRFYGYQPTSNCVYFGACYTSSNHFLMHVGGGFRYYIWGHVFLRPEAHYYHIVNNTADFSNNNVIRVGASIGYTIGPD